MTRYRRASKDPRDAKSKGSKSFPACPTCGLSWGWMSPRVKNGRTRTRLRRVYWPRSQRPPYRSRNRMIRAACPDPFHDRAKERERNRWNSQPEASRESYDGLNRHGDPEELATRRKVKARKHRERQGKGRR